MIESETKLADHARWEILHFLDVEMDIAKQQMDDPSLRVSILEKIKKYVEGHEYGAEYLERRYG